jgi:hypothetical protein
LPNNQQKVGDNMATMKANKEQTPLSVDRFLGLNREITGDTQLKVGESGNMTNFYITKDLKLKKIDGYLNMLFGNTENSITGMFYGYVGGNERFVFAWNGHIYSLDLVFINWEINLQLDLQIYHF